mgnify:CR=1 FL=1
MLAGRKPVEDFHPRSEAGADPDRAGLEQVLRRVHEYVLGLASVDDRIALHCERVPSRDLELAAAVHAGTQSPVGVRDTHAHTYRASALGERQIDEFHVGRERLAPGRREAQRGR